MALDLNPGFHGDLYLDTLNYRVQRGTGDEGIGISDPERFYRDERRYSNESEYAYYCSDMRYMFYNELISPPEKHGFDLLQRAAYWLHVRDMRVQSGIGQWCGDKERYYTYVEDILFVNYRQGDATIREGYSNMPVPLAFMGTFDASLRYRFNCPLDCIHGTREYCGNERLYCICVAIPEKISIMEKLCWESMLGANTYYQCMKMREVISNPAKYGLEGTQASASALLIKQTAAVDINGRRFLDEPENGNA